MGQSYSVALCISTRAWVEFGKARDLTKLETAFQQASNYAQKAPFAFWEVLSEVQLRANIGQLERGLKIADGGKEKMVPSGRIDITAEDQKGSTVIIELKAGTADRDAIGQLLSYIGDMATDAKQVRGILVAGDFTSRAVSAARAVPTIALKKYNFRFSFNAVF